MKFVGIKKQNKVIYPPVIAEERRKCWARILDGTEVETSFMVKRKDKSDKQLGAIWGLMISTAVNIMEDRGYDTSFIYNWSKPTGIAVTKGDLCGFLYTACPIRNKAGQIITLSKANTEQAAKFFDDARNVLASQWAICIADPNPNWRTQI